MHASTRRPVLYSFRRCPYAIRARLALAVSGCEVDLVEVALKAKPPALLQASPKGTVPVLVLADGRVLEQSLDIMDWALRGHDPQQWLCPAQGSPQEMLALTALNDGPFKHHLDRYKYPTRYPGADAAAHRAATADILAGWQQRLSVTAWLMGERVCLADMAIAPFVRQFAATDAAWFDAQPWPALQAWLRRITDSTLFAQVMAKPP